MTVKTDMDNVSGESALRYAAKDQLGKAARPSSELANRTTEEIIHELRVYQIELEIQNDELRRIQTELEDSRNNYQDLYDFAPIGYFTVSRKGVILEVNLTGASLLGIPRPKLINLGFGHFVAPESESEWYQHLINAAKREEKQSCELSLKREDGSSFYVSLESIRTDTPVESAGENYGSYMIRTAISDITERKRLEQALEESEIVHRTLCENIPGIVYRVGLHDSGKMQFFNSELYTITGFSETELSKGQVCSIDPLIVPEDKTRVVGVVKQALTDEKPFEVEYRIRHKDGNIRCLRENGRPIKSVTGEHTYIDGVIFDVTERKRMEEEKDEAIIDLQKALSEVRKLSGFLPICASCKKIRDDQGYWNQIEKYISDHSEALFSHGICPDCARKVYPELYENK